MSTLKLVFSDDLLAQRIIAELPKMKSMTHHWNDGPHAHVIEVSREWPPSKVQHEIRICYKWCPSNGNMIMHELNMAEVLLNGNKVIYLESYSDEHIATLAQVRGEAYARGQINKILELI